MASVLCVLLRTPRKRLGVLHLDRGPLQKPFTKDDLHLADALAAHVSAGIESAQLLRKQRELFYATITMLAQAVELRDEYTGGHTAPRHRLLAAPRPAAGPVARRDLHLIRIGTPLHDIGKIGIDDAILRKPGKLTPEEFEIMKTHTTKGAKILEQVADLAPSSRSSARTTNAGTARATPTAWPARTIPHLARIVAVADAFDAMTSATGPTARGCRPRSPSPRSRSRRGKQFDPEIADAFLQIRGRILQEMQSEDAPHRGGAVDVFGPSPGDVIGFRGEFRRVGRAKRVPPIRSDLPRHVRSATICRIGGTRFTRPTLRAAGRTSLLRNLARIRRPQRIDDMPDPHARLLLPQVSAHLDQAADVAREHGVGPRRQECLRLALAEPLRHLRLRQVVAARGAAADLALGQRHQLQLRDHLQQLPRLLADLLAVAEMAGVVIGRLQRQRMRRLDRAELHRGTR